MNQNCRNPFITTHIFIRPHQIPIYKMSEYEEEAYSEETTEYVEEDSNGDEYVEEETTETYEEEEVYED